MIDALIKRVSVTYKCYEMYAHRGKNVQLLMFWDRSRNERHLVNYRHCLRVCRIVIKSVQQCTYFLFSVNLLLVSACKFVVNKRQNTNYSFLHVTSKVSCIRRKRGQIICLQGNNKSVDGNFRSQKAKSGTISCLMWNIYLYFIISKLFTNFQNI